MKRLQCTVWAVAVLVGTGCESEKQAASTTSQAKDTTPAPTDPKAKAAATPGSVNAPSSAATPSKGSPTQPGTIPANTAMMVSINLPNSLGNAVNTWLPQVYAAGAQQFKDKLKEAEAKTGMNFGGLKRFEMFMADKDDVAMVIHGATGTPKNVTPAGNHNGLALFTPKDKADKDQVIATSGDRIFMGKKRSLTKLLDTVSGKANALANSSPMKALAAKYGGATLAITASGDIVDKFGGAGTMKKGPMAMLGSIKVDAFGLYGTGDGLRIVVTGDPATLNQLKSFITMGLAMAKGQIAKNPQIAQATKAPGVKMLVDAALSAQPVLSGNELTLMLPIKFGDPKVMQSIMNTAGASMMPMLNKASGKSGGMGLGIGFP